MKDTSPEMEKYYHDLIMLKTPLERFIIGLEMIDDGYRMMVSGIRNEHPGIDEKQLRKELLKRQVRSDPTLKWLEPVIETL
jgi:hypothetical protein